MKGDSLNTLQVRKGEKIKADWANDLIHRVADMGFGDTPGRRPRVTTGIIRPFSMILAAQESPSTNYDLILWPGTVNGLIPSNIFTPITYDPTTTRYIKLEVTTDGYKPTGATVVSEAGSTGAIDAVADTAPTSFEILIGVLVANKRYQTWVSGNITCATSLVITAGKAVPVPGTSPYTYYYTWHLTGDLTS